MPMRFIEKLDSTSTPRQSSHASPRKPGTITSNSASRAIHGTGRSRYFFWDKRQDPSIKPRKRFYHYLGVPFNELDILKGHFLAFLKSGKLENNDRFYIIDDQLCVDFVIRYENLDEDFKEVCRITGIPRFNIPHLKAGIRKERRHYSEYYDDGRQGHRGGATTRTTSVCLATSSAGGRCLKARRKGLFHESNTSGFTE